MQSRAHLSLVHMPGCRGISVMEDEGQLSDHTAGISATDGTWHHIAVTWQSSDGAATLYDNGRKVRPLLPCHFPSPYPSHASASQHEAWKASCA